MSAPAPPSLPRPCLGLGSLVLLFDSGVLDQRNGVLCFDNAALHKRNAVLHKRNSVQERLPPPFTEDGLVPLWNSGATR